MIIKLKINIHTIAALHNLLEKIYDVPASPVELERVHRSIGYDLAAVFEKKFKAEKRKADNLFDVKKKITMSFKYHEAWTLRKLICDLMILEENEFNRVMVHKAVLQLDPKLQ